MPTIDPKVTFWLGVVTTIFTAIAGGTIHLTHMVPDDWIPTVTAWASFFAMINSAFLTAAAGFSSSQRGPLTDPPKAAVAILAILVAAGLLFSPDANAQARRGEGAPAPTAAPPPPTVKPFPLPIPLPINPSSNPLEDLAKKIAALSLADFKYAAAMADATNNTVSAPCWHAWTDLLTAQQQSMKDAQGNELTEPDPHLITDVERLSELLAQLRPDSKLSISCAALASAAQRDAGTLISAILNGGALGLFKLPIPIGPIP